MASVERVHSAGVSYRRALAEDAERIARQGRTAFLESFEKDYSPEERDAYLAKTYGAGVQLAELTDPESALFVAECGGDLIGHVKLGPMTLPYDPGGLALEIRRLYLLAAWQGHKIGQNLITLSVDEARRRGAEYLCLSCWTGNPEALRFYERQGFRVVGRHPFPMGERMDEDYLMCLGLGGRGCG